MLVRNIYIVFCSVVCTILIIIIVGYASREQLANLVMSQMSLHVNEEMETRMVSSNFEALPEVIKNANPAVVAVVATKDVPIYEQYYEQYDPWGGFFGGGFQIPRVRERGTEEREVGGGSGFFVSKEGMIVTNRHVIADESARYSIVTNNEETFEVELVAQDSVLDIAILKVVNAGPQEFPFLTFGDSNELRLGETVIVIGNALAEFRNSVSVGIVSGLARNITARGNNGVIEQLDQVIQTDAAINPGNSGGPMINVHGQVVGVSVATTQGANNISFALPSSMVAQVVTSVQESGVIERPYLGVRYTAITPRLKESNNLSVDYGVLVSGGETPQELAVMPGSPADKAGIVENDIIIAIDGRSLQDLGLSSVIRTKNIGDSITLTVIHKGEEREVVVVLEKMP
ncbi:MAG: S1C family serine protease [Candidatus Paceibacteria bacterium]